MDNEETQNSRRLIDEALVDTPIENTLRLAWEFIKLNKKFTFTAMGIFVVLNLFGAIPLLSLVFAVLAAVFTISIQMHVGRTFYGTENIETYIKEIEESRIDNILTQYSSTAFGVYLGWFVLIFIMAFLLALFGVGSGLLNQNMSQQDMLMALASLGLPLLLFVLVLSYVQPLVYSNIILANSFGEGFKAVFTIFSKDVWSSAMQKIYFAYVAKIGLLIMAAVLLAVFAVGLFTMIPFLGLLASIAMLMGMYVFVVLMAVMSMVARRMVEE
ncbi:MAG TPA: hypothetical protein ENK82_09290 [Campylobacterales bacterium]|nr:hypothetical protein [Campylobacterales bacterium]HHS93532.1 hypothetical protein [Campylobacterales bacterium]